MSPKMGLAAVIPLAARFTRYLVPFDSRSSLERWNLCSHRQQVIGGLQGTVPLASAYVPSCLALVDELG